MARRQRTSRRFGLVLWPAIDCHTLRWGGTGKGRRRGHTGWTARMGGKGRNGWMARTSILFLPALPIQPVRPALPSLPALRSLPALPSLPSPPLL